MSHKALKMSILASFIVGLSLSGVAAESDQADLWKAIKEQQATIDALNAKLKETEQKIEATADAVSAKTGSDNKTVIGGYGELHINQWDNNLDNGADKNEMDFHRFVLLFSHEFTDSVRFFSEFELEHALAGEGKKGEVELEQAYIQWDFAAKHNVKTGVFLIPVGILNETHEPETFYGVERNSVENKIIPSTWWEGGAVFSGEIMPGLSYDVAAHSGLSLPATKFQVRDGRQKVSEAKAEDFAYTGRIKYTAIPGLELATSVQYQEDFLQSTGPKAIDGTLIEAHAVYQVGLFSLRALYAIWNIDDAITQAAVPAAAGADEQTGWYIEPSLKLNDQWGLFARHSFWDNQAGDSANSEFDETSIGTNFWLTETTVFKFDIFQQSAPDGQNEYEGFNLGVGYSF
jgi:Phosphate-selective porin O and P